MSFVCGAVLSGLVSLVIHKKRSVGSALHQDSSSVLTLLAATIGRPLARPVNGSNARYQVGFKILVADLPILSSLTVFILLYVVRKRLWIVVAILCGFLAGYWTSLEIVNVFRNRESVLMRIERHTLHTQLMQSGSSVRIDSALL